MFINTQQPINPGALAQLYANGSPDVSSQVSGWLNDQGHALGIGDPTNYFAGQRQMAMNQQAAQQGQQAAMYERAGVPNPNSQYAIQQAQAQQVQGMHDQYAAQQAHQAQQLAGLQFQNRLASNPLPQSGVATASGSVLDDQERFNQGFSRDQWTVQKRLGPELSNQLSRGASQEMLPQGMRPQAFNRGVTADAVLKDNNFRGLMQRRPDLAEQAFEAITGMRHATYLGLQAADTAKALAAGESGTQTLIGKGLNYDEKKGWTVGEKNPTTGEVTPRSLTAPELEQVTRGGKGVIPLLARKSELIGMGDPISATPSTPFAMQPSLEEVNPLDKYNQSGVGTAVGNALYNGVPGFANPFNPQNNPDRANVIQDTSAAFTNFGRGVTNLIGLTNSPAVSYAHALQPPGGTPQNVRQQIQSNPRLLAYIRSHPESASRIIAALQNQR